MKNEDFIQVLSEQYYTILFQYVSNICSNKTIVPDIIQDTFLIAYEKAELLQKHPNIEAWLYRTAQYRMLQILLDPFHRNTCSSIIPENIYDTHNYKDECIASVELYCQIFQYIEPDEKKLFLQRYESGYPIKQLAKQYHTTEASIKMRLLRIRKKLRTACEKYYEMNGKTPLEDHRKQI